MRIKKYQPETKIILKICQSNTMHTRNYFNIGIINFPNRINQEESFYISFYIKTCSCEKKTHKRDLVLYFTIKQGVNFNTI